MDLIHTIHAIQQKPPHVRQRILVVSVVFCMGIIIVVWLMIVSRRIDVNMFDAPTKQATIETVDAPFVLLKDAVIDAAGAIRAQISEFNAKK
ncbi:MAG: hypothetical protein G01um101470_921 [Parcubacteria group bacterium Gr01-1014_70]|nr:MAG: hypothetical protein G01um101470_921 [Parcubacteria group bacterium Gr01-1014_70]